MAKTIKIKLGRRKYLIVDLAEPLKENTKAYPGDPKLEKIIFSELFNGASNDTNSAFRNSKKITR